MTKTKVMGIVLALLLAGPLAARAQSDEAQKNAEKARAALNAMVQALGGDTWLQMKNQMLEGKIAAFIQGRPDLGTTLAYEYHAWPDKDRIEVTKHKDVVGFFLARRATRLPFGARSQSIRISLPTICAAAITPLRRR